MDWSRAKNILILLFLALNIGLGVYWFISSNDGAMGENIQNTEKILKERGYVLNTQIPHINEAYKLIYESGTYNVGVIREKLLNQKDTRKEEIKFPSTYSQGGKKLDLISEYAFSFLDDAPTKKVDLGSREKVEKYTKALIKELEFPMENPRVDVYMKYHDQNVSIRFIEQFEGSNVFNNCVEFRLSPKGLVGVNANLVKAKGFEMKKVSIVPAYQILLKYFMEGKNKRIESIDLGYRVDAGESGTKAPEWRVRLSDGTTGFYDIQGQKAQE